MEEGKGEACTDIDALGIGEAAGRRRGVSRGVSLTKGDATVSRKFSFSVGRGAKGSGLAEFMVVFSSPPMACVRELLLSESMSS